VKFVVDASIWIDLSIGDLIAETFTLPFEYAVPDVVLEELQSMDPGVLRACGIHELTLAPDDYPLLRELISRYPGPTTRDLTALVCALRDGMALMSGDGQLRTAAEAEGVRVHGVLWLLDRLVERSTVPPSRAADSLEAMLAAGARLPQAECGRRLAKWRT